MSKEKSDLWHQGEPIAVIPPNPLTGTQEGIRLIEVIDGNLPLSIIRINGKEYPFVGERYPSSSQNSSMYRPLDSIVHARFNKDKHVIRLGYLNDRPVLDDSSVEFTNLRALPYACIQEETGLHFWEDKPLFVMTDRINCEDRSFLMHGDRVIDSGNRFCSLTVNGSHMSYAKQTHNGQWTIHANGTVYQLLSTTPAEHVAFVNSLLAKSSVIGGFWACLATTDKGDFLLPNYQAGGKGFSLSHLSFAQNGGLVFLEEDFRQSKEGLFTVVQSGFDQKRFPLPWIRITSSQSVKHLMLVKETPVLIISTYPSSAFTSYGDDHSPLYDEILPDSLQADDKALSFIARKGFSIFRVTRAI